MDIWMVAVAAGASYIAQHFKKSKQVGGQIPSESSSSHSSFTVKPDSPKKPLNKKWPFHRLAKIDNLKQDDSKVKGEVSQGVSSTEATSTSEICENGVNSVNCEGSSVFSSSTLSPGFVGSDRCEAVGSPRSRMLFRTRRVMKPLSSLESCLMAQLCNEHIEMKEYVSSPFASPSSQTMRPFLVTDGSKVINRSSRDAFMRSSEIRGNDAMLHVCLGMSFGILYSFMANRREVEKLNRLLNQTQSLVQDLEEELEMKDSLIMQELTINGGSLDDGSPYSVSHEHNLEQSIVAEDKEFVNQKAKDESFSKIEAELEAELEMLEMNMTSSTLERRISNLAEVDPDFEPDVAQGELRADMVDNTNEDESRSTNTTHSANYAVSPRELSLRLHELLQSQLEERIRELEAEIESKQTPQNHKSWKDLSSSEAEDENPNPMDDEPVVLNLSGEALDAYNEACNEFANLDESDEEDGAYSGGEGGLLQLLDVDGTPINGRKDEVSQNSDEQDFDDDEMEKLLIKHIVEKARQGSPVVLNAQRALFSE